jgi:DNA-binding SARP family transcriptional activator/TolB-like protein
MIYLRTLGTLELKGSDVRAARAIVAQPKRLALLAYLALANPRGFHRRDSLFPIFWSELDMPRARNALRQALHALRASLGDGVIVSRGDDDIGLDWSHFSCDAELFERALDAGQLEEALELYRGDVLPGFYVSAAPDFERWLEGERGRLRRRAAAEAWRLSERAALGGDISLAVQWARHVAAFSPDDEGAVYRLLNLLDRVGDRTGALHVYDSFKRRLADDYDMEPSVEMDVLIRRITTRRSSKAVPPSALVTALASMLATAPIASGETFTDEKHRHAMISSAGIKRVAVLPFIMRGDDRYRYLSEGVADMLGTGLDGGNLRRVDARAVASHLDGAKEPGVHEGRALSHRLGAHQFILGSVLEAGGFLRLNAVLYDADGTELASAQTEPDDEKTVFSQVDNLARRLLAAEFGVPGRRRNRSAAETTASLPAFKRYLEAERFIDAGHYLSAREALDDALHHDPEFALAWHRLSGVVFWFLQGDATRKLARKAAQYADRLSEHDRSVVDAFRCFLEGDATQAERRYRAVVNNYPDDVEGWLGLGRTFLILNPMRGRAPIEADDAIAYALLLDPENLEARMHQAYLSSRAGSHDDLKSLRNFLPSDSDYALLVTNNHTFACGDRSAQDALIGELSGAPDLIVHEAARYAAVMGHNLEGAERIAHLLTHARRIPETRATGHVLLAHMALIRGRVRDARTEFRAAKSFAHVQAAEYEALAMALPLFAASRDELGQLRRDIERWNVIPPIPDDAGGLAFLVHGAIHPQLRHYLAGLLDVRLGHMDSVAQHAAALEASSGTTEAVALASDLALALRAHACAGEGKTQAALALLEQTRLQPPWEKVVMQSPFFSQNLERFTRAWLLESVGRLEEALTWYDTICENGAYEFTYLAPSHLRRGVIHERLGNRDQAAHHFARVTELWSDCDDELVPVVEQARAALNTSR